MAWLLSFVSDCSVFAIFGGVSLYSILGIAVFVAIAKIFINIFAGG